MCNIRWYGHRKRLGDEKPVRIIYKVDNQRFLRIKKELRRAVGLN